MTDYQRIHPVAVDVETPRPTQPLASQGSVTSEKGDAAQHQVPLGRTIATMPPPLKPPERSNCCCKCLCWTIGLFALLLIIVGATAGILYLEFQPKLPKYAVDNLRVSDLTLNFDLSLCQGSIPRFYQGHQNRTVLDVALTGRNQYGRTLLEALQEQQQTGRIPLDLKIIVPVSIKLGKLKLKKVKIPGTCNLIVDSLSTNSLISIKASTCNFGLKL